MIYSNKLKYFIFIALFFLLFKINAYSQVGYVEVKHPVYTFLQRMDANNFISNYDQFELPKTRRTIANYLIELNDKLDKLNSIDKKKLNDFIAEFEYDIYGNTSGYKKVLNSNFVSNIATDSEKFLYFYNDSTKANIFVNFIGEGTYLLNSDFESNKNSNTTIFKFGGRIRGSLFDKVGFSIQATNGTYNGDKNLALGYSGIGFNYKVNAPQDGYGDEFFDETEGYLVGDFDNFKIKIGRDRLKLGYGSLPYIMGDNFPPTDYINLSFKYKALTYTFYQMKLLGKQTEIKNPIEGGSRIIDDKYWVYHRLGINFSKHFTLGAGEIVVYANRNIDFSYLNPFNFYKSAEHTNQDRDNTMLFFDFTNNSIDGIKFFGTLLIDDIDFGKIGSGWYGNKLLWNFGALSTLSTEFGPIDCEVQYLHTEPYVYSHRIFNNNYTSFNSPLISQIEPNSEIALLKFYFSPFYRLDFSASFQYTNHGANSVNEKGEVTKNFGGDILVGHRVEDSKSVSFLDGNLETKRVYSFEAIYEFINQYKIKADFFYSNFDGNAIGKVSNLYGIISLLVEL